MGGLEWFIMIKFQKEMNFYVFYKLYKTLNKFITQYEAKSVLNKRGVSFLYVFFTPNGITVGCNRALLEF